MKLVVPRSTRARFVGVLAIAALSGAAVVATMAFAHTVHHANRVTLSHAAPQAANPARALYRGKVRSAKHACEKNREVQVFHVTPPNDTRVARTRSNGAGDWKASGALVPNGDKVYALIETKVLKANANHDHSCKVDRSGNRRFPYP
jgi:hypothetical protein